MYLPTYVSTYLCTYLPMYLPTYVRTYLCAYLPMYLPTYVPSYLCTYLPMHVIMRKIHWTDMMYTYLPRSTKGSTLERNRFCVNIVAKSFRILDHSRPTRRAKNVWWVHLESFITSHTNMEKIWHSRPLFVQSTVNKFWNFLSHHIPTTFVWLYGKKSTIPSHS